jgi:hypothetical protein
MRFINFKNKKVKIALVLTLILLVNFYAFAFLTDELKTNKSKIINETNILNDFENNLKSSGVSPLFDSMYIHHNLYDYNIGYIDSNISYSLLSADIFNVDWLFDGSPAYSWQVNSTNREITASDLFPDYTHTPFWIFPDVSLGDTVLICSIWDSDHTFEVSEELIYDLPGFGLIEVLVLQDLAYDNCSAWYEKSTGILLNGTFYYGGGYNYLIYDFISTNVAFTYFVYDSQLFDGMYILNNFSIYDDDYCSTFSYTPYMGYLYYETWEIPGLVNDTWIVDTQTRIMSGGSTFGDGTHTTAWIFTNVSLGDTVLIAADAEGDHLFQVSSEISYDIPGFGAVDVWVLEDLDFPGGWAWYEKNTGILINCQFFWNVGGDYNYTMEFIHSNVFTGFSDDFENGLCKWEKITGLWHLTNTSSAWPDPCHSPIHSMWFGQESTGNYETGLREMGDLISIPFSLIGVEKAILEFYHWREGEAGWDYSYVYISTDGINWDLIYSTDAQISPWEKVSLDISGYVSYSSLQLRFFFDTHDSVANAYRGWLVDDIQVITYDLSHELSVSLEVPRNPELYNIYSINATVANAGKNDESNVDLLLYLNDVIVDSITILDLPVNASETINYMWTPTQYGSYNFTTYAPPVTGEEYIENNIESQYTGISSSITGPVAIFRNNLAWDMNTTELILQMYGIDYTIYNSSHMGTVVLTQYEKVIIESDQDQLFYDTLGSYISWFESYATSGGILEIHAFDHGWHSGIWDGLYLMPGGFDYDLVPSDSISINLTGHPILLDPYIITDEELDGWDTSVIGYFTTFPSSSKQILLESSSLDPVFIELDYGEGTILITLQCLEWGYYQGYSNFLENVVLFNPDSFILTAPDSSSEWETDASHNIYWESSGTISNVKLELYKNNMFVMEIISSTPNDGEYIWTIPAGLDDSTQYQIKISDFFKSSTFTFSEYFEIFNPTITISTPDSSSIWERGSSESVYWTSRGTIPNVMLQLYLEGIYVMDIIASTSNDGEFLWEIPSSLVESDQYQIKIIDVSDPSISDYSDYFEIEKPPSGEPAIPGYNLSLLIGIVSVVSVMLSKKRYKKIFK